GIGSVGGTGSLGPGGQASADWLIVPSTGSGGSSPLGKRYGVKAAMSYSAFGVPQTLSTFEDFITVKPQPAIQLEYVLPFEVFADEALTPGVEPIEPFSLGLRVSNIGLGTAKGFEVASGQPKIVENAQGLLIDFKILATQVGGETIPNTLLIPFGDVAPGGVKQAAWVMTTTLSGRFDVFEATFTHAAELGGALTSLIQSVTTYTLIKDVLVDLADRDAQFDFLVNTTTQRSEIEQLYQSGQFPVPDVILESDQASPIAVANVPASLSGTLTGATPSLTMSFQSGVSSGVWVHAGATVAASVGGLDLISARRSDGKSLNAKNFWTSEHFDKDTLETSYEIQILDLSSGATEYVLSFDPASVDQPPAAVGDLSAQTGSQGGEVALSWTAPGEDGNSGFLLGGRYLIQREEDPGAVFSPASAQVNFATATAPGATEFYLIQNAIGNTTFYLHLFTQDGGGGISGLSNQATAYTLPNPPQTLVFETVSSSFMAVSWQPGNNRFPIEYQVYVDTDTEAPFVDSSPFFDSFTTSHTFAGLLAATTYYVLGIGRSTDTLVSSQIEVLGSTLTPIDVLPPRTSLLATGPQLSTGTIFVSSETFFGFSAVDDFDLAGDGRGEGVLDTQYAVDSDTFSVFAGTFSLVEEGTHTLEFFSRDTAGNVEAVEITTVAVDNTPPATDLEVAGSSATNALGQMVVSTSASLGFLSQDPVVSGASAGVRDIFYGVDGGTLAVFSSTFSLSEGSHTLAFFGEDQVDNVEVLKSTDVYVDGTPPLTGLVFVGGVQATIEASSTVFVSSESFLSFVSTDPAVLGAAAGVDFTEYRVDSATTALFDQFFSSFTLAEGTHTVEFRSRD
ncbi:MAG: fibronectin type III domain-containing protein, partial [Elusimicrobia bacterium]|nr:fibronectin type III domain-containing protein [Elusimicrobiota bacterium]